MNYKKHTAFMIDFISDFVNGEIERYFFDLDYSAYAIKHFSHMERENSRFAEKFANNVDQTYDRGSDRGLSDEEFRVKYLTHLINGPAGRCLTLFNEQVWQRLTLTLE